MSTPVPVFPVPSFADLTSQVAADFTALPGADVTLRMGVIPTLTMILSKLTAGEYIYLQNFPNRCLIPTLMAAPYLDVYCAGVGLTREPASAATGSVVFTGTAGIPIPAGAQMQDSTGTVFLSTTATASIAAGQTSVTVPVVASTLGAAGNLAASAPVTLLTGIAGILANAVVASPGLSGGVAVESDAALQVRLAARLSNPPQGGANPDYVAWTKLVPGVTRVWVYPTQYGPGTVGVTFTMDGRANPIPLTADVTNVQNSIDQFAPVTAVPTAFAVTPTSMAVTVQGLTVQSGYTLATVQANIISAIAALNYSTTPGGYGWDGQAETYLTGGQLFLEQVYAAIANAPGVANFNLAAPSADVSVGFGDIVQFAAPTFT